MQHRSNKRQKEEARKQTRNEKKNERAERKRVKSEKGPRQPGDEDPDIAGIVPGPQPVEETTP